VTYAPRDFWPLNTALWVKEFIRVPPTYAYFLLADLRLRDLDAGVAVPTLNRNDVHRLHVVLPPSSLVRQFDADVAPMFGLQDRLRLANAVLRRTRDLLLPKLLSGEVDVSHLDVEVGDEAA
jgi:type I restriction enzyme S subunit